MNTFLYTCPNAAGNLRVISSISLGYLMEMKEVSKEAKEWGLKAEVGQYWNVEGTYLIVRVK